MPNIRAAAKRMRADSKRAQQRLSFRTELKTLTRRFREAVQAGKGDQARTLYQVLEKRLDQAGSKRLLHRNTVSRRKARLVRRLIQTQVKTPA